MSGGPADCRPNRVEDGPHHLTVDVPSPEWRRRRHDLARARSYGGLVALTTKNTLEQLDEFCRRLDARFTGERSEIARRDLDRYLNTEPFTGRKFEELRDAAHPDVITEKDLVAVEMLSVTIPPRVSIWILRDGREQISSILADVPTDLDLWERPALVHEGGRLLDLWRLLSRTANWPEGRPGANEMGRTKTSKLIAAKRPRLAPVLDTVVCDALGPVTDRWEAFAHALGDEQRRELIEAVRPDGCQLSVLRVIDVVVWMAASHPLDGDPPIGVG